MSEYRRRNCSNCGEPLGFSESDPCEACRPFVDVRDGLLIPKNQAQSLSDFYDEEARREDFGRGPDIVRSSHEKVGEGAE
jgi:hypothetical protein